MTDPVTSAEPGKFHIEYLLINIHYTWYMSWICFQKQDKTGADPGFPREGAPIQRWGGANLLLGQFVQETACSFRKIWLKNRGCSPILHLLLTSLIFLKFQNQQPRPHDERPSRWSVATTTASSSTSRQVLIKLHRRSSCHIEFRVCRFLLNKYTKPFIHSQTFAIYQKGVWMKYVKIWGFFLFFLMIKP